MDKNLYERMDLEVQYLSLSFVCFVVMVLGVYYLVQAKLRGGVLLAGSLVFYACFDVRYLILLLFVAASTFACAKRLGPDGKGRPFLVGCLAVNGALWWAVKVLPAWVSTQLTASWIVPVGISYYMLQAAAYLVDVYRGRICCETRFWKYLLFLSYFPGIIQGPISRYDQLGPQLTQTGKFNLENILSALTLVLFGMVKKLVIADRVGIFVNYCFGNYAQLQGVVLYVGAVLYAFQLYADFSGCVDICRGVSAMFGIELTRNFDAPYMAQSIKEFWSRWHLSLSSWLKDYIYIPMGGNRKGKARKDLNLAVTFAVSGIWHGAGWNFLVWGVLQALYQILGEYTQGLRTKVKRLLKVRSGSFSDRFYRRFLTFHLTVFSWIFFRAENLACAVGYICNMFASADFLVMFSAEPYLHGVNAVGLTIAAVHLGVMMCLEWMGQKKDIIIAAIRDSHMVLRWGIYLALIFDILLFGAYGSGYDITGFLYGGF